jgi:hypothetical protein
VASSGASTAPNSDGSIELAHRKPQSICRPLKLCRHEKLELPRPQVRPQEVCRYNVESRRTGISAARSRGGSAKRRVGQIRRGTTNLQTVEQALFDAAAGRCARHPRHRPYALNRAGSQQRQASQRGLGRRSRLTMVLCQRRMAAIALPVIVLTLPAPFVAGFFSGQATPKLVCTAASACCDIATPVNIKHRAANFNAKELWQR